MSSKPKAPENKEAPPPAADAHGPADPHQTTTAGKGAAFKQKIADLKASLGGKFKGLPKPDLKIFFRSAGAGLLGTLKEIVLVPRWAFSGDSINRVAALGFIASLGLFVLTAPQVFLMVLKKRQPAMAAVQTHGPQATTPTANTAEHHEKPVRPSTIEEEVKQLNAVVFLGTLKATITGSDQRPVTVELEAFAECVDDESVENLKTRLSEAQGVLLALLKEQTLENLTGGENKTNLSVEMKQSLNGVLGQNGIKAVFITKSEVL